MSAALNIEIPPDVVAAARFPRARLGSQLAIELALQLYREGILEFAPARKLAGLDKVAFHYLLGERGICRQYDAGDLADDLRNLDRWRASGTSGTEVPTTASQP